MASQITATLPTLDFPREVDYPTQEDWAAFSAAAELNFGILGNSWSTQMQLWKTEANAMSTELNTNATIAQGLADYQGDWISQGYTLGQTVSVSGIYYICKLTHATGQNPTTGGSIYWNLAIGNWNLKVNNYGNETIGGVKTFSSSPIVPTPTTNTQVANKAYADLKVALADFTGTNVSFGSNGYQKFPSGLIIQWGSATSSASGQAALTLPITFPNTIIAGSASYFVDTHTTHTVSIFANDYKPSSISALVTSTINGSAITSAQVKFIVIGY